MSLLCQDCGTTIYRLAYRGAIPQYCSECKRKRYKKYHAAKLKRYRRKTMKIKKCRETAILRPNN